MDIFKNCKNKNAKEFQHSLMEINRFYHYKFHTTSQQDLKIKISKIVGLKNFQFTFLSNNIDDIVFFER